MAMLTPFFEAPIAVQVHMIAATTALGLTPVMFLRKRRDRLHKAFGYMWMSNMVIAALSSFAIMEIRVIGPFSPIHILSVVTLWGVWQAIALIRARNISGHRATLGHIAFWGLGVAGALSFLPGRTMSRMFFAEAPETGFAAVVVAAILLGVGLRWIGRRPSLAG